MAEATWVEANGQPLVSVVDREMVFCSENRCQNLNLALISRNKLYIYSAFIERSTVFAPMLGTAESGLGVDVQFRLNCKRSGSHQYSPDLFRIRHCNSHRVITTGKRKDSVRRAMWIQRVSFFRRDGGVCPFENENRTKRIRGHGRNLCILVYTCRASLQ